MNQLLTWQDKTVFSKKILLRNKKAKGQKLQLIFFTLRPYISSIYKHKVFQNSTFVC